uniref:Ribosomal protein L29 n=1 Tax=Erythroglossum lusitanicum TaxID=2575615 RepID=A0A4D6WS05_9FLOR|nr:ribosomal protein L29 [Erythroglossum lusitanicum]
MTSNKEINSSNLTIEEINNKIITLKKELILLKIQKTTKQTIKPHLLKKIKNQVAKIMTLKTRYINQNTTNG